MMRRATLFFGAAVVLAACGCGNSSAVSPAPVTTPAMPVSQSEAMSPSKPNDTGDVLSVLSVEHQLDVATERDGVVVSVAKDEGSMVSKGEVLGQLDDRMLQTEMVKAHDDLAVAQNNV